MPGQRFQSQPTAAPDRPADTSTPPDQPAAVSVQRYRSHSPLLGVILGVVVVVFLAGVVVVSNRLLNNPSAGSSSTPALPVCPTPSPGWQAIPYESGSATGCWAASEGQWDGDIVTIATTVTPDQGSLNVTFFALDNATMNNQYSPDGGTMMDVSLQPGQSSSGTLIFEIPRGDFTLYMAKDPSSATDAPIQAMVITG